MLKKCVLALYCSTVFLPIILGFSKRITLGGLFEEDDPSHEAFILSVNAVNRMRHTSKDLANVFFVADSHVVTKDVFEISRSACFILGNGTAAIFGPSDKLLAEHVQSICDSVEIPNVVGRFDVNPTRLKAFNLYPYVEELSKLFLSLVKEYNWKKYTILYDNSDNLILAHKLLKRWNPLGHTVTVRQLGKGPNYRKVLLEVRKSKDTNIVIDCSYEILEDVLIQSQQAGLLSDDYHVIVTNLNLHTLDLEPYQYSGVNFTGVRLVDVENREAQIMFNDYLYDMENYDSLGQLPVEAALTYDSVQLFARAFKRFRDGAKGNIESIACNGMDNWALGASLSNDMRTTEVRGLTGLVKLDSSGFRRDFELDILRLNPKGVETIGTYNSTIGIKWDLDRNSMPLTNKTFKVLISLLPPYNMLKKSALSRTGNDRYEGFAIDIIEELSKKLHFNYTFIETDLPYGSKGKDGKWDGMLGRIIDGEADLAITDLTITAERESAVDFTLPFWNIGIEILFKAPTREAPTLFAFLSPFSTEIWILLGGSYICVSLCLFVLGRMCPAEWNNPYPCIDEPEELKNQFTLKNAFWFTLGSIMQQGSEIAPIALSTRMLASAWWFFCLMIVALYTANLAAFLVVDIPVSPIKTAEDLAALNGAIKYGAKRGGATFNFFKASNYEPYVKMYDYMVQNDKEVMTDSNEEGTKRVLDKNQNYAFLMESSSIEYITNRECSLAKVGGKLDAKGYGIAMKKNMKYRHNFNQAVLTLQENGIIGDFFKKWWTRSHGAVDCSKIGESAGPANPLTLENVGGVFVTLGVGIALAIAIALWECIWGIGSNSKKKDVSFKDEFVKEFRFVMKCKGTSKATEGRKASGQTTETSTRASTPPYDIMPTMVTASAGNR